MQIIDDMRDAEQIDGCVRSVGGFDEITPHEIRFSYGTLTGDHGSAAFGRADAVVVEQPDGSQKPVRFVTHLDVTYIREGAEASPSTTMRQALTYVLTHEYLHHHSTLHNLNWNEATVVTETDSKYAALTHQCS